MNITHEVELTLGRDHPTLEETLQQARQQAGRIRGLRIERTAICCTRWPVDAINNIGKCGLCGTVPVVL